MGDLQCQNQDPIFDLHGKSVSFFDLQGFYRVKPVSPSNINNRVGDCLAWLQHRRKKMTELVQRGQQAGLFLEFPLISVNSMELF